MQEAFFFDPSTLSRLAETHAATYKTADPFPHTVFDNFLPLAIADELVRDFPSPTAITWKNKTHEHSKKLACQDETQMPASIRHVLAQCNSSVFVRFLEELTGIEHLIPDPHLEGGGMHQIEPGGYLDIHADFNMHDYLGLYRRLNLLLYLNKDWKEEYGGHIELWNKDMTRCEKKVLPVFNRCVIFTTSDFSYHGHPTPLACPPSMTRKSLALYYYTASPPADGTSLSHSTLYQQNPQHVHSSSWKTIAKKFVPPIVFDVVCYMQKRK